MPKVYGANRARSIQRAIAAVLVAAALVLLAVDTWFVKGLLAPIIVSSGSMAPALLGPHRHWQCVGCRRGFDFGIESPPAADSTAICPYCGVANERNDGTDHSGSRVLVNRVTYLWRRPRRWEVVVFRGVDETQALCVKRVVGLPGETVRIERGDVWIDGQIARKNLVEQRALNVFVARVPSDNGGMDRHWRGLVRNDSAYDQTESRVLEGVHDITVDCRIRSGASGTVFLSATIDGQSWVIRLDLASGAGDLERSGAVIARFNGASIQPQTATRLEWILSDKQVLLALDGKTIVESDCEFMDNKTDCPSGSVAIDAHATDAEIMELQVFRDIYYLPPPGRTSCEYQLGPDEYFVLGDNGAHSVDSRVWAGQSSVLSAHLVGRACLW